MNKNPRDATRVGNDADDRPGGRQTRFYSAAPDSPGRSRAADNRMIVGVLVSYTWVPEGQLFPVRQGRTHIGSGNIKDNPDHEPVEVQCPDDKLLSGDNTLILVQQGEFYIQDLASTNGTFINGKKTRPETTEDLPNGAEIKVGATVFTFLKFDVKAAQPGAIPVEPQERPESGGRSPTTLR